MIVLTRLLSRSASSESIGSKVGYISIILSDYRQTDGPKLLFVGLEIERFILFVGKKRALLKR